MKKGAWLRKSPEQDFAPIRKLPVQTRGPLFTPHLLVQQLDRCLKPSLSLFEVQVVVWMLSWELVSSATVECRRVDLRSS
jgi:hypothetical protein